MNKKFIVSYSGGKDSTLALYRMMKSGNTPKGLLITLKDDGDESWFHSIPSDKLLHASNSMDIPLIKVKCKGDDYEKAFEDGLKIAKGFGADSCIFGDIDIAEHRKWCTERCEAVGLEAIFPLWQEDRELLTNEFIESGFKAILKKVNLDYLSEEYLGKVLDKELVQKIKATGADPCGENGEYHTFVYDGPIYHYPIKFDKEAIETNNNYGHLVIG